MIPAAKCPDCKKTFDVTGGEIGDTFECDDCFAELIVESLDPPIIKMVEEEK